MGENSTTNFLIFYIVYLTFKNLMCIKPNSVNLSYPIIDKTNGYVVESNENKYFTLAHEKAKTN